MKFGKSEKQPSNTNLLIATIAAVLLYVAASWWAGSGESQQSAPLAESKPVEPVAEVPAQPSPPPVEAIPVESVVEAAKPTAPPKVVSANKGADPARGVKAEPPTAKAPDISFHAAIDKGNIEAVKQHLAAGADVNAKNDEGETPIDRAVAWGEPEIVELLIAKGADVNVKDDVFGKTPLDRATGKTAALLRKHGGKTGEELKAAGN
jgi:hypothetical protein